MRSNSLLFLHILAIRAGIGNNSMDPRQARKFVVGRRRCRCSCCDFAFLQYDQPNDSCSTQHSRRGVCRLGGMRNMSRRDRARFSHIHSCATAGKGGKRKEHGLRVLSRAREFARSIRRRKRHDHQSAKVAGHLFPVSLGRSRSVSIASSSSGARGQDEL